MLLASGFSCRKTISMVTPWCLVCDANGPLKMEITFRSMGGNATKYYLKTSPKSPGMKNVGVHRSVHCIQNCCFIAKETGNLLKKLEIGMCIVVSIKRPRWMTVESQSPKMWYAPKTQSNKLLSSGLLRSGKVRNKWKFFKVRQKSGKSFDVVKVRILILSLILREDLTRIPGRHISNFDPLGKGETPPISRSPWRFYIEVSYMFAQWCQHGGHSVLIYCEGRILEIKRDHNFLNDSYMSTHCIHTLPYSLT